MHKAAVVLAGDLAAVYMGGVSSSNDRVAEAIEVDQRSLLGIVAEERAEKKVDKTCTTRVRRGAEVVEIPIPCTN